MEVTLRFLACFSMLLCLIASLSSASSETVNTRKYTQERPLSADDRKDVHLERVQQTTNKTESLPDEKRHSANESKSKLKQKPSSGNSRERVSGVTPFSQDAMTSYLSRKREWEDPSFDVSCFVCELTVGTIQKLLSNSTNWDIIEEEVVKICILFKVEDARVCRMVVKQFQEEVHYVFGHLVLSPSELCGTVLGTSCSTPYNPGEMWNVTLPTTPKPTPQPPTPPKPKSPTLRFLQITDMHLDFLYKAGSVIDCGEPVCCRENDVTPSLRSGKVYGQGAGRFGDYQSCDAPLSMVLTMFKHLSTVSDQFDYVIFTGDIPAHDVWNQSRTDQLEHIYTLDHLLSTYLPDKPVYYCLGNHESAPVNSYPPPGIPGHSMDWMYGALAEVYMKWLPQSALDRVLRCGSYSYSPYPGFRIISVNSNYCNRGNWWLLLNATDPCGELEWLIQELQSAENLGEKVHILTHIPTGGPTCLKPWSHNYYKIINRYENTVVNQFYGHTHKDWYQMFYDDVTFQRPVGFGFIAPSVTPYSLLNPTYRVYTMDGNYTGSSWAVLDFNNFYLNLTAANLHDNPSWDFSYSPKEAYKMAGLYATDWEDLLQRMEKDDSLFQKFHRFYHNLHPTAPCHGRCKDGMLCDIKEGRSYDPDLCTIHR